MRSAQSPFPELSLQDRKLFLKKELHGKAYLAFGACYIGSVEEGKRMLQPLATLPATADPFQRGHALRGRASCI